MDWTAAVADGGGWVAMAVGVAAIARALLRGDLVLGREYDRTTQQLEKTTTATDQLVRDQRTAALEERSMLLQRIETMQSTIDRLSQNREGDDR